MIQVDPRSAVAPFQQIKTQIADQIRYGGLPGGQRLPSIRQLAADLRVAAGTVAKAYAALESEGMIETSRTRGTRVAPNRSYSADIQQAARQYVQAVGELDLEQVLGVVRAAWLAQHAPQAEHPPQDELARRSGVARLAVVEE